jgi:hypothetical protein
VSSFADALTEQHALPPPLVSIRPRHTSDVFRQPRAGMLAYLHAPSASKVSETPVKRS